jgi:hypothetical protein
MIGKVAKLAQGLRYRWRSRHLRPEGHPSKPRKRKVRGHKPGWGEGYYGYSHPAETPPRFGASGGPYDNNRPRGLAGLALEAILRRLVRRKR